VGAASTGRSRVSAQQQNKTKTSRRRRVPRRPRLRNNNKNCSVTNLCCPDVNNSNAAEPSISRAHLKPNVLGYVNIRLYYERITVYWSAAYHNLKFK